MTLTRHSNRPLRRTLACDDDFTRMTAELLGVGVTYSFALRLARMRAAGHIPASATPLEAAVAWLEARTTTLHYLSAAVARRRAGASVDDAYPESAEDNDAWE